MQNLSFSLVQFNIVWENPKANFLAVESLIERNTLGDIVVLPEMFSSGFTMKPNNLPSNIGQQTQEFLCQLAVDYQRVFIGGSVVKDGENYKNRLFVALPDGSVLHYDKKHLFTMAGEQNIYKPGNEHLIFEYNSWKIAPFICYDLRFPVWLRNTKDVDVQLFIANWPEKRIFQWSQLLQARAIENQVYVVGVNRVGEDINNVYHNGMSAAISPLGKKIIEIENQEGVYTISFSKLELQNIKNKMPFLKDKDNFQLI